MADDTRDEATRLSDQAMSLLRFLITVEDWAKDDDPRAQPYFDGDAVRWMEDEAGNHHLTFHPERFDEVMKQQGN